MKKLFLLTISVLLLFTACSPVRDPLPEREELDLEKLKDGVYVDYDRTRFENVTAPKRYYAEYVTVDESDLRSYFSLPQYLSGRGSVFAGTECCNELSILYIYRYEMKYAPSVEELDFMPLSELYERFENDTNKFVPDVRIHDMLAITAEEFAEAAAETDPPDPEKGWSEPKDFYYIRARQYVGNIPIFAGISVLTETLYFFGSVIEACYSEDGIEEFSARGLYSVGEEAPVDGTFIDLSGAEQIIRDQYELIDPYNNLVIIDCDLVYVAVLDEEGRTVLTPAWEFYKDYGPSRNWYLGSPRIRINAYTGEFMR